MPGGAGAARPGRAPGLGLFLAALRWTESGSPQGNYTEGNGQGAYQIIQSNWISWAHKYANYNTTDPNASHAPKSVQDTVAAAKVNEYYYGAGEQNWRLVARIWNGGTPNVVPNPALGPGATTDTYASIVLDHAKQLADSPGADNYAPGGSADAPKINAPNTDQPGDTADRNAACVHSLKIPIRFAPDFHLCMDKPVASLAITGGGVLMLAGVAVILVATVSGTSAGRAGAQALALVPAGRVLRGAKAVTPAARAARRTESEQTAQASEARRMAPVRAEERRSAAEARRRTDARRKARLANAEERRRQAAHEQRIVHRARTSNRATGRSYDGPNAGRSSASIRRDNLARHGAKPAPF